jgi:hypothetical protein
MDYSFRNTFMIKAMDLFSGNLILQQGGASPAVIRSSKPLIGVADSHTMISGEWLLGMSIGSISFQIHQFLAFGGCVLKHVLRFVQATSNFCGHVDSRGLILQIVSELSLSSVKNRQRRPDKNISLTSQLASMVSNKCSLMVYRAVTHVSVTLAERRRNVTLGAVGLGWIQRSWSSRLP